MNLSKKAILVLEDGRTFRGEAFGAEGEAFGEMVFNTSMSGYQEILTDPSYAGQIVAMTYPLIGNYGVNEEDTESRRPWVEGFVVREASRIASNWRSTETLDSYLKRHKIVGIEHIDTRALVRHIRDKGAMRAAISSTDLDEKSLLEKVLNSPEMKNRELASSVTVEESFEYQSNRRRKISRRRLRFRCKNQFPARVCQIRLSGYGCSGDGFGGRSFGNETRRNFSLERSGRSGFDESSRRAN